MAFLLPFLPYIVGGAEAGASAAVQIHGQSVSHGRVKEMATAIVNSHEASMKANVDAYQMGAVSASDGLREYDRLWASMVDKLGELGQVGQTSIGERSPGGRWPYRVWYRDPISSGFPVPVAHVETVPSPIPATLAVTHVEPVPSPIPDTLEDPVIDIGTTFTTTTTDSKPLPPGSTGGSIPWIWILGALGAVVAWKAGRR